MKHSITLIFCFLVGCSTLPNAIEPNNSVQTCAGSDEIYVVSHGWHTGIVVKAEDINNLLPALATRFPKSRFYEIGWGDSGFYQANEITTGLTFRAMFWSSGSVVHVVAFNENPRQYFYKSDMQNVKIDHENYGSLLKFLKSSFQVDITGNIIKMKLGIYGDSQFYTGIGTYQLFNTCNKWTAKALYSAGLDINPMYKFTSSSVMSSLKYECANQ